MKKKNEFNFFFVNILSSTWGTERYTVPFCFASVKRDIYLSIYTYIIPRIQMMTKLKLFYSLEKENTLVLLLKSDLLFTIENR